MKIELSKGAKALTETQAYQAIVDLHDGVTLSKAQLDGLLLHFAPPIPKKPKSDMDWLSMACNLNDESGREIVRYIHVHDGKGYSSDGCRAHCAPVDLVDGCYCPKTHALVADVDFKWEPIDRVLTIPKDAVEFAVDDMKKEAKEAKEGKKEAIVVYRLPGSNPFNGKYFEQAISIGEPGALFVSNDGQILHGKIGDRIFVIAGLRE